MKDVIAVFGHRGARGLLPENTLGGFALARRLGLAGVEFDIALTADGVAVVHHDPRLNPDIARDQTGSYVGSDAPLIRELSRKQLESYDVGRLRSGSDYAARYPEQQPQDGAKIPTFADVLEACGPLDLLIEIKTFPDRPDATVAPEMLATAVINALRNAAAIEKTVLYAFDWRVLEAASRLAPELRRSCLTAPETVERSELWFGATRLGDFEPTRAGSVPRAVASTGAVVWAPFHKMLDETEIAEAHRLGLSVIPWTVNEDADIDRAIDLGVDGIISDWPDRVQAILGRRGYREAGPGFVSALPKSDPQPPG